MVPASNISANGLSLDAWVRQTHPDRGSIIRRISTGESERLFGIDTSAARMRSHHTMREGAVAPWQQLWQAVSQYFAMPFPHVPTCIDDIISPEHVQAFRGGMGLAMHDFNHTVGSGTQGKPKRTRSSNFSRSKQSSQAKGGLVFTGITCPPMYLAEFWQTGNIGDIVPLSYVHNPLSVIRREAWKILAQWYPDQEVVQALATDGVPSKDRWQQGVAVLGTNHKAALEHYPFVDKMYKGEVEAGRMAVYGILQSPPVWPMLASPTGAVFKKLRDGTIDPDNMRPTADYSWPPPGYWMSLLLDSPNASVDLERDFPYIHYIDANDLIDQILFLDTLGAGVK
jgi:hypothetical protein